MVGRITRLGWQHIVTDLVLILFTSYFSLLVLLGYGGMSERTAFLIRWLPESTAITFSILVLTGIYEILWRYFTFSDGIALTGSIVLSSALQWILFSPTFSANHIPSAAYLLRSLLMIFMLGGVRATRRFVYERKNFSPQRMDQSGQRVLIYGAGRNGLTLLNRFRTDSSLKIKVIGFIDDDPKKKGMSVGGVRVLGAQRELAHVISEYQPERIVITISDLSGIVLTEIMQICRSAGVRLQLISDPVTANGNGNRFDLVRELSLSDLLKRPQARVELGSISELIQDKTVLITGAGGSIGSEIARQVCGFHPSRVLLLDHSEYNLYTIDHELRASTTETSKVVPLLIDIRDRQMLSHAMREYRPQIVFHAAAYKHVHLVEFNPMSAILNNVEGTRNLLQISEETGVESFVLISTDKAVNPVGVMGATKRICELMVADMGMRTGKRYCAVRFGNVVGSSGSLIPLLKKQIRAGGPVTITDRNMTRYFMLIKEAVALVLKAGSIANPGDICILRMGDPIPIVEIAKNLILLLGRTEKEVPIIFTGARPGEKLYEELYFSGEELNTEHPDILVLPGNGVKPVAQLGGVALAEAVEYLIQAARTDHDAVGILMGIVKPAATKAAKTRREPVPLALQLG